MAVLTNIRHERFAQGLAGGLNATEAYNSAGYRSKGAAQNAARLKARPSISTRVQELQSTIAAGAIAQQISDRNARVQALEDRRNGLGAALDCLLRERAKDMAEVPGGQSGLLCREFKNGKESYRIDPGVMAVMAELRALERQAAQELGQWADRADGEVQVDLAAILNAARDRKRKALIEEERFEAERKQKLLLEG